MTERKRAKSIRKIGQEEISSLHLGGAVDDRIPKRELAEILDDYEINVDREEFFSFLGQRVGYYRSLDRSARDQPTIAQELKLLAESMELILETRARLINFPPTAKAYINQIAWNRHREPFNKVAHQLSSGLEEMWSMIALAERELEEQKGRSGAKKNTIEIVFCLISLSGSPVIFPTFPKRESLSSRIAFVLN